MKHLTSSFLFRAAFLLALALLALPALFAAGLSDPGHLCVLGMAAATLSIDTPERAGLVVTLPIAAATPIYAGTLVATNAAGYIVSASDTAGLRVRGRAEAEVDNSAGAAGDQVVNVKAGVFRFANSAANAVDPDDIGKECYVEDNQTVAETSTHKVKAGIVVAVDADGVWVDTRFASRVASADTITGAADLAALKVALLAILQAQGLVK